jgi:hypothetical protein
VIFPALDQQVLHSGSEAAKQPDQMDRRSGLYAVRGVWKNPDASYADTGMDDYVSAYLR